MPACAAESVANAAGRVGWPGEAAEIESDHRFFEPGPGRCDDGFIVVGFLILMLILAEIFPDVVRGLQEDMGIDLENLKEQYEEQRRIGVEKLKSKYR